MVLLIPAGKENKKSFRDLVALEQGLEGQRASISPAKTGKEIPNKDTKHRTTHTQHTQELSDLQIAQHLHHLTTTHLQLSGTCFSLTRPQNALHQQPLFYHMCCCECGAS